MKRDHLSPEQSNNVFAGTGRGCFCIPHYNTERLLPRDKHENINDLSLMMVMALFTIFPFGFLRTKLCRTFTKFYQDIYSKQGALFLWHYIDPKEPSRVLWRCYPEAFHGTRDLSQGSD